MADGHSAGRREGAQRRLRRAQSSRGRPTLEFFTEESEGSLLRREAEIATLVKDHANLFQAAMPTVVP